MYYVVRGRGRFKGGGEDREVSAGSVIYVAAEVEHRFYDIEEELTVSKEQEIERFRERLRNVLTTLLSSLG